MNSLMKQVVVRFLRSLGPLHLRSQCCLRVIASSYGPRLLPNRPRLFPLPLYGGVLGIIFGGRDEDQKVPPYVKRQLIKAQRALRDGDYVAASKAYHRALERLAGSEYAQTQCFIEARAVVLDKLANMYLEQGLLEKAEVTFKETMRFMLSAGVYQESAEIIEISLKLSKIYTNLNKHELAENGFLWCVETAEQLCTVSMTDNNLALWGMCLQSKGQYHLSRGEWNLAITCLRKSLQLCEDLSTHSLQQVGVLHNDLATALDAGGELEEAEFHARVSLRMLSNISSPSSEYLGRVHYNLAMILQHQGKVSEAKDTLIAALGEARRSRNKELLLLVELALRR